MPNNLLRKLAKLFLVKSTEQGCPVLHGSLFTSFLSFVVH